MKKIFLVIFFALAGVSLAYGAQKSKIELMDGSTLEGEVISVEEGIYTIKNSTVGILKIGESKIRAIRSANPEAGVPVIRDSMASSARISKDTLLMDDSAAQAEIQRITPAITGNPEIMQLIPGLISNPEFQAILKDPAIAAALKNMDIKTLMTNEKFLKIVHNPAMQEITRKVQEQKDQDGRKEKK